ncbi:tripartite tricarboxylate transporter TctB family protein [Hyphomicrobium sp. CS1BSMeth3]|uniref:tripartite tricarboxylate transporter TctB family protein n=1 Tax=Hyphomicrobium sp. CS1BSMeth3 TaxID=1892844 RepID=UPI000930BD96|nr:tripartite tricarboxylate transporter TctB family protein [Hyphomicrobium sp. CS1BSMeth3]
MRRGWLVAAGTFLVLFAGTIYLSSKLPLLDALGPGPGFFPLILALLGVVLSLVLLVQLVRQPDATVGAPDPDAGDDLVPDRSAMFRIAGIIVLLLAAFTALDPLGYRLTALVFITLLLLVLGVRNYIAIALVALALSFGVFHSFYYWLKVPLPIGAFGL